MHDLSWLLLLCLPLLILTFPRRTPAARALVVLVFAITTVLYLAWRLDTWRYHSDSLLGFAFQATFLVFELLAIAYDLFSSAYLIRRTDRRVEAAEFANRLAQEADLPSVTVMIPSYNEGPEVVIPSLRAARDLDWPSGRLTIVLLDDGKIPTGIGDLAQYMRERQIKLSAACTALGVKYLHRPDAAGGKGGNLNYGLARTDGEYLGVLDADFQPSRDWLRHAIGFLHYDRETGILQCPQTYRSPDPVAMNLWAPWEIPENQNAFMNVVQPARDALDSAFCVGSGFVVKRSLLEKLGGFPSDTVAEDVTLTLAGLAVGAKTRFLGMKLAHGLAPQSSGEYVGQQCRWAAGAIQHLWHPYGPFRNPELNFVKRIMFLEIIIYWFTFVTIALMVVAPAVYWLVGVPAVPNRHGGGMDVMALRLLVREWVGYTLTGGRVAPLFTLVGKVVTCLPVASVAVLSLLMPGRKWPFRVTKKLSDSRRKAEVCWPVVGPLVVVAALTLLGMYANCSGAVRVVSLSDMTAGNLAWTWCSLAVLGLAILAGVDQPWDLRDDDPDKEVSKVNLGKAAVKLMHRILG